MAVGAMRKPGCEQAALAALRTAWAAAEAIRGHDGVQADEEALQVCNTTSTSLVLLV